MRISHFMFGAVIVSLALLGLAARAEDLPVKNGEKIAFMGDSITQDGASGPGGYVHLTISGLKAVGVQATAIPAGISGHKSNDMLKRLEKDVLEKKPQWMTLSCGVNDVWHGAKVVPLEDYKKNITEIVDKARAADVKVVMLTATVIHENLDSPENQKLEPYNAFLRDLAKERKLPTADLNAMFQERLKAANTPDKKILTSDGVHMNPAGDRVMAEGILRA